MKKLSKRQAQQRLEQTLVTVAPMSDARAGDEIWAALIGPHKHPKGGRLQTAAKREGLDSVDNIIAWLGREASAQDGAK